MPRPALQGSNRISVALFFLSRIKGTMNITELREEIATNFLREPSHTKRLNKTYEVLDGIDHKRPFCYVASGMNHVEAFQLPKTITSPRLDEIITNIEKQQEGMWYYYDGNQQGGGSQDLNHKALPQATR
jgi:hypothetical protein